MAGEQIHVWFSKNYSQYFILTLYEVLYIKILNCNEHLKLYNIVNHCASMKKKYLFLKGVRKFMLKLHIEKQPRIERSIFFNLHGRLALPNIKIYSKASWHRLNSRVE